MLTFTTSIQYSIRSPSQNNQGRKRNKSFQIEKEKVKLSLFEDDIIPYIEKPKDATKKKKNTIDNITEFGKFVGYKSNIQNLVLFYMH